MHLRPSGTAGHSRPTPGLPEAPARRWSSSPTATTSTWDRAGRQADRRGDGADARLQRLDPRPDAEGAEGSEVVVDIENQGDMEATVHWHGLRLENHYDGTARDPAADPGRRRYTAHPLPRPGRLLVPPAHPRGLRPGDGPVRQRDRRARRPGLLAARHRDVALTLDDILVEDGKIAPFSRAETTYSAMGRFGNVLLVGGETGSARSPAGRRSGAAVSDQHREHPRVQGRAPRRADQARRRRQRPGRAREFVDEVILAPSERVVIDVLFDQPGAVRLEHRTPERTYRLASIRSPASPPRHR